MKGFTLFGSGQFPWGEQEVYKLNDEDAYLAGTAEVPVTSYYSGEILKETDLPKNLLLFPRVLDAKPDLMEKIPKDFIESMNFGKLNK